MKSEVGIFLVVALMVAGCATESQKVARPSKQTPTCLTFKTDNVLYSAGLDAAGVGNITRRTQEYLTKNLKHRGITLFSGGDCRPEQPKLLLEFKTIEAVTVSELGLWS